MASIVKANANLTNGGLSVLRRSFVTTDDGTMRYEVDYCCLSSFASKWTPYFRTRAQPPTPLPEAMLQLQLTKTPELYDLTTETANGLTYFKATYSAGISSEVIITEESDVRNFTITRTIALGYNVSVPFTTNGATMFVQTGTKTTTETFDYISVTVTAESKNANLPSVSGYVRLLNKDYEFGGTIIDKTQTLVRTSKTRNSRGEYTYRTSSSGIIKDIA